MRRSNNGRDAAPASLSDVREESPVAEEVGRKVNIPDADDLERFPPELLRRRWRSIIGRSPPPSLSRQLMVRILSWRGQISRGGDLDARTRATLAAALQGDGLLDDLAPGNPVPSLPRPGSVLVREHGGTLHRVMVLKDGFAWNGNTYASLSSVARAITGTSWNGRRFFGFDQTFANPKEVSKPGRRKPAQKGGSL